MADAGGNSAQNGTAQLPESPTAAGANDPLANANPATLLQDIQVGENGIVLHTSGRLPEVEVKPAGDRSWLTLDIPGARLSPDLQGRNRIVNRLGVQSLQVMAANLFTHQHKEINANRGRFGGSGSATTSRPQFRT